jgi:hypothetical protein
MQVNLIVRQNRESVKNALAILLSVEIVLTVMLFGHMGHSGHAAIVRASLEWQQHPTLETRQALARQKRISRIEQWAVTGCSWSALGTAVLLVYCIRKAEPAASPNGRPAQPPGGSGVTGGPPSVSKRWAHILCSVSPVSVL